MVILPFPGRSHYISFARFFKGLAEKGHNVTVVGHYPLKEPIPNYRDIEIGGAEIIIGAKQLEMLNLKNIDAKGRLFKYLIPFIFSKKSEQICEIGLNSTAVQSFMKEENNFDVDIVQYFSSDCFLTLAKKFNVPVVRIHSCSLMPWSNDRFGNPDNPAYIPNNLLPFSDRMTFLERVENTVMTFVHGLYNNIFVLSDDQRVATKYFGELGATLRTDVLDDSLLLVATHFTFNLPRPLVPSIIEIGGIHIGKVNTLALIVIKIKLL